MSTPTVPQRPTRSPNRAPQQAPDLPQVPPRPQRVSGKSQSREREAFARSPLNSSPFATDIGTGPTTSHRPSQDEPKRPPGVASLPLIGQEGIEYASLSNPPPIQPTTEAKPTEVAHPKHPHETRNVASDLPLHAPKASNDAQTQRMKVAAVTRTDSEKASVAGVGRPQTEHVQPDRSTPEGKFRPPSAISTERPSSSQAHSLYETDEHGIPSFGTTIPLYPNAGDVQAPTPTPGSAGFPPNELSRPGTTDGHRRSAHSFHGPPGSYGLHGHGHVPHDKFEKAWYDKHPEERAKEEEGAHHPAAHDEKPEWAMSSDDLNKLVHGTGHDSPGMGKCYVLITASMHH